MDDFLHNLRSGKLKQADRSGRSYGDPQYKGGPRRNVMDRRKRELETFERLNAVKEVLDTISETQKRMAAATEARTRAEERKARAMEILAQNIYRMINPNATDANGLFSDQTESESVPPSQTIDETVEAGLAADSDQLETKPDESTLTSGRLSDKDRDIVVDIIGQMRADGENWEKIARHIASMGYPTASGRGTWRGITAKNLFEKSGIN